VAAVPEKTAEQGRAAAEKPRATFERQDQRHFSLLSASAWQRARPASMTSRPSSGVRPEAKGNGRRR
jgi:hypothetical protein